MAVMLGAGAGRLFRGGSNNRSGGDDGGGKEREEEILRVHVYILS